MCMCSKNMNIGNLHPCGSNCVNLGPFRAVRPGCTPPNTGSIIPFSSGITPVVLTTLVGGLVGTTSLIGFGTAVPGITIVGNTIDLSGVATEAFAVPRNGSITAISASFTALAAVDLGLGSVSVTAQIYRAPAGSSVFTATNARVTLTPPFTGLITLGQTSYGSSNVPPVPVAQGDRLLMVYSIAGTGVTLAAALTGTASAGITIS
ncbi:exosporium glycoprotein BclB-related protein [Solibacillus sp. NPDC093137]|uniref:exosporium glycoprotein BclB-related protein n=1 Tax=Solibacillus sp. NPDC093137 TaxID=3390678 RepID=UPI003D0295BA